MDDFIPIKNIMNELYAKDISRKVRSAHNTRGRAGEPLAQPPYPIKSPSPQGTGRTGRDAKAGKLSGIDLGEHRV